MVRVDEIMWLTQEQIEKYFTSHDYSRGLDYYNKDRVENFLAATGRDSTKLSCTVIGVQPYHVKASVYADGAISASCTCPQFNNTRSCKHIVAALLEYIGSTSKNEATKTDFCARNVLDAYLKLSQQLSDETQKKMTLEPQLNTDDENDYPVLQFTVGCEKMYKIKNVDTFLKNVTDKDTVSYGKFLSFNHAIDSFDEKSQQLIYILMDQFPQYSTLVTTSWRASGFFSHGYLDKSMIRLRGGAFDSFFKLYQGQTLKVDAINTTLQNGVPHVEARLTPSEDGALLEMMSAKSLKFFGGQNAIYAVESNKLFKCSDAFREKVYPLLAQNTSKMRFAKEDLPTFCSCVLPEISEHIEVHDDDKILPKYIPDECEPYYYFDMQAGLGLVGEVVFSYGGTRISSSTPESASNGVKRNLKTERAAQLLLKKYLQPAGIKDYYHLQDEDAIAEFLSEHIDAFRSAGEVFVSDQLRNKRISSAKASVGISVSNGLLTIEVDTGDFPPSELEALYDSLLKKKKYHRLRDGRFLELEGTAYEKIAEMSHMLQLPAKALDSKTVTLPAFRGLYLDKILRESEGLQISRDAQFRSMIRSFKSVEDSDFAVPQSLNSVLRPYQKTGFRWLKTLEASGFGGILADEMGLGKTLQVIAFLMTATRAEKGLPSIIVCPSSLVLNWADELAKFAPSLKPLLLIGDAATRRQQLENGNDCDVIVTSYDILKRDIEIYDNIRFYCCVLDEGQYIKNQSTVASRVVKQLVCKQRFVLTGTPIENRLSELWNLFDFLMPGYLFSHKTFMDKLEKPIIQSDDPAAKRRLGLLVQPFLLRRLKADVLKELPPKIEYIRKIQLSENERKIYIATALAARSSLENGEGGKLQLLAALMRLRQICCDPNICYENYEGETSKMDACIELCSGMAENGHQILLFSQFTTVLSHIKGRLDALKISSFVLEGSTPKEKRARLVKDFNAGEAQVFLISLKAGGTGLNLTAADVVIHYDPWWNIAAQNQATDRAHRIGQQAHVQVYKLIAKDTLEEKILQLQAKKAALMDNITEDFGENILSMPADELMELLQ